MLASVKSTNSDANSTKTSSTISQALLETLRDVGSAITVAKRNVNIADMTSHMAEYKKDLEEKLNNTAAVSKLLTEGKLLQKVELVAIGGWNEVWMFKLGNHPVYGLLFSLKCLPSI
jgi:hypothetical protein